MRWSLLAVVAGIVGLSAGYLAQRQGHSSDPSLHVANLAEHVREDGATLYALNCVSCHKSDGSGHPEAFPPLVGSEWALGKSSTAAAILLRGIAGPLRVKGHDFNGYMPAFGARLSDAQIADVLTYVRSQWGNTAPAVDVSVVSRVRALQVGHDLPFAGGEELERLP